MQDRLSPKNFLMAVSGLSLFHTMIFPEWYTCITFVISIVCFVTFSIILPVTEKKEVPTKAEIEELRAFTVNELGGMKTLVTELANHLKQTTTKVSGLRMQIGIKD